MTSRALRRQLQKGCARGRRCRFQLTVRTLRHLARLETSAPERQGGKIRVMGGWGYLARIMPGSSVDAAHTATATPVWPRMIGCVHRRTPAASRPPLTKPHGALHIALHVAFSLLNVACCPLQLLVGRHRRQAKARVLSCPARRCPLHLTRTVPPIPIGTEGYDDDMQPTADRRQHA